MTLAILPLALSGIAWGGGVSLDTALVRPSFAPEDGQGVPAPWAPTPHAIGVGLFHSLEVDPVVIWAGQDPLGAPVALRHGLWLGGAWAAAPRLILRADIPMFDQGGDGQTPVGAPGLGLGDLRTGVRWTALALGPAALALSGDLFLPTSAANAWMGERNPRFEGGMILGVRAGPVSALASTSFLARTRVDTTLIPDVGDTIQGSGGLSLVVWKDRADVDLSWIGREPVLELTAGSAPASELLLGMRLWPRAHLRVDLAVGKGLAPGVGSSEFRTLAGLGWVRRPPTPPPPAPALAEVEPDDAPLPEVTVTEAPPPVVVVTERPLAWVALSRIEIRDPIQFEYGTARILPPSVPTLEAVAAILDAHPEIDQIVIEGHASEEGSFAYNYALSLSRGVAVFEALIRAGVHPERLSVRSMGEVRPVDAGESEADKASNRRVEFHIAHRMNPGEQPPVYTPRVRQPWDGEPAPVVAPTERP